MSPSPRQAALLTAVLLVIPSLALVLPAASAGSTCPGGPAEGTGAQVFCDPIGDAGTANGKAADLVRLGMHTDASKVHFYVQVLDATDHPTDLFYVISFSTGTIGGTIGTSGDFGNGDYSISWKVAADGTISGETTSRAVNDPNADSFATSTTGTPTVARVGTEFRIDVARDTVGSTTDGQRWTNLFVQADDPVSGATLDANSPAATYTVTPDAAPPAAPGAPRSLAAHATSSDVALSWAAPLSDGGSPITTYTVLRGTAPGAETPLASVAALTYDDATAVDGVTYTYVVTATNAQGTSPPSNEVSATPSAASLPGAPRNLAIAPGDGTLALSWSAPISDGNSPITSYNVYRGGAPGSETFVASVTTVGFLDANLNDGSTYFYSVAAVNAIGEGPHSANASGTPTVMPTYATTRMPATMSETVGAVRFSPTASGLSGEPTIGYVGATDSVGFQAGIFTAWIQLDRGAGTGAWALRSPPNSRENLDPILFTDTATGRTWAGGDDGACHVLGISDDAGRSWTPAGNTCTGAADHESVGSGPYHAPKPANALYDRAVYLCAQDEAVTAQDASVAGQTPLRHDDCVFSYDGGTTFSPPVPVAGPCAYLHGHIRVGPDGTAYLPNAHCGDNIGVSYTEDNGASWQSSVVPGTVAHVGQDNFDPGIAITPDNKVWLFYSEAGTARNMVTVSTDHARTWSTPVDLGAGLGFVATTFQKAVAGDNGRVAVAYLATKVGDKVHGDPFFNAPFGGVWDLYVTQTLDDGATWQTFKASTDPVQRGNICSHGSNCAGQTNGPSTTPNRGLLDFMDVQIDGQGRLLVGYADGCVDACATDDSIAQSTTSWGAVTFQTSGRSLLSAFDHHLAAPSGPPSLSVLGADKSAKLSWTAPSDGGSPITGYDVFRGTQSGAETLVRHVGATTSFVDADLLNGQEYFYKVRAVNVIGAGAFSAEKHVIPAFDSVAPSPVRGLRATSARDHAVDLAWTPSTDDVGVDHYVVSRDGVDIGTSTDASYHDAGLQDGAYYAYSVAAVDAQQNVGDAGALTVRPVTVPTTLGLGTDLANDAGPNVPSVADLRSLVVGTSPSAISFDVRMEGNDFSGGATGTQIDLTVGQLSYFFQAEQTDANTYTTCLIFKKVGVVGTQGADAACSWTGKTLHVVMPRSAIGSPADGSQISAISASTYKPGTTKTSEDRLPDSGALAYTVGAAAQDAPTFTDGVSSVAGAEAAPIAITFHATHPDDHVTYVATGLPSGASLDRETGAFSWTPTYAQAGSYTLSVGATTGASTATKSLPITIANVDRPLVLDPVADASVAENQTLTFTLHATDPDSDPVRYSGLNLPNGMSVNGATGVVSWTPSFAQAGVYHPTFKASAGPSSATRTPTITVVNTDRAPVLGTIPGGSGREGALLTSVFNASDPDNDALVYSVPALPGASFTTLPGHQVRLSWRPAEGDAGEHPFTVTASDGTLSSAAQGSFLVQHAANFTLAQSAPLAHASPGEHVQLSVTITNRHACEDTFALALSQTLRWTIVGPANVTVPAGASATVVLDVLVPANEAFDSVALDVASLDDASAVKSASWAVDVPLVVKLVMDGKFVSAASGQVTGHVEARYLDGSVARGASVAVTQTPESQPQLASSVTGSTASNGAWSFSFVLDPRAKALGIHDIVAAAHFPGVDDATDGATYFVG